MKYLFISKSFRDFLNKRVCEENCIIGKILLRRSRIEKIKHGKYDMQGSDCYGHFNALISTDECNYLTFRNDGTISYLPAGKEHQVNENKEWKREGRQNAKPAKVLRKLILPRVISFLKIKDIQFENFTNAYKSNFATDNLKFEILESDSIGEIYDAEILKCFDGSPLAGSCMKGESQYLQIYAECKCLQIVALFDADKNIHGRALLWKVSEDRFFLDRFYCGKDHYNDLFIKLAKEKGWLYKVRYNSYDEKRHFIDTRTGESVRMDLKIETDTDCKYYPYIDTFSYGGDGFLTNYCVEKYQYNNTDGTRDGEEREEAYCDFTDRYVDEVVYTYDDMFCDIDRAVRIHHPRHGYCYAYERDEHIEEVDGEYFHRDSEHIIYSDYEGEYIKTDDAVYCEDIKDYANIDNANYCQTDGNFYSEDSDEVIEAENGIYYLTTDPDLVQFAGKYYHYSQNEIVVIETTNDNHYKHINQCIEIDGKYYVRQFASTTKF